jgi:hypothetical protein
MLRTRFYVARSHATVLFVVLISLLEPLGSISELLIGQERLIAKFDRALERDADLCVGRPDPLKIRMPPWRA